ncbi:MAG: PTS fructose transporter subunit IIB [Chloroflexota bacterium]|jgi:PTS system galactitol-specific IIB component|nr:PTS fructose transporter subunit IIB [Chloroflexota bacterium]
MAKQKLTVLAVCGAGVVSSTMIAQKIEDVLSSLGVEVEVVCLLSASVEAYLEQADVDFIVTTSPIPGDIQIPVVKGVALLTGFNEEAVVEEIQQTARQILGNA